MNTEDGAAAAMPEGILADIAGAVPGIDEYVWWGLLYSLCGWGNFEKSSHSFWFLITQCVRFANFLTRTLTSNYVHQISDVVFLLFSTYCCSVLCFCVLLLIICMQHCNYPKLYPDRGRGKVTIVIFVVIFSAQS